MNKAPKQAPPKKSLVAPVLVIAVLVIVAALGYKGYLSSRQEPLPAPPPIADNTRSVPAPSPAQRTAEASEDAGASATSTPAPASVPAIQQFLAQNQDANYAGVSGADALGYNSLRSAMLDALAQIGGPES